MQYTLFFLKKQIFYNIFYDTFALSHKFIINVVKNIIKINVFSKNILLIIIAYLIKTLYINYET